MTITRVHRDRRDDRYQTGHPAPGKRASAGVVVGAPPGTVTATIEFSNYRSEGAGTPTPIKVGTNPWGDADGATYTESRINRYSAGSSDGHRWHADTRLPDGFVPSAVTGITFEADIVATNGGSAPGATLRTAFVLRGEDNTDYIGEFNNNPGGGVGATPLGVMGTGTVTADFRDDSGVTSDLSRIVDWLDYGFLTVVRYDNFVSPYSGNYTLRCSRIRITVTYEGSSASSDTVSVLVDDEVLTNVIPLGEIPPPGAIAEVEARGDLMVVRRWWPGPVPVEGPIVRDIFLTRGRVVANPTGTENDLDYFVDFPATVTFHAQAELGPTFMYPVQYDGHDAWEFDFVPATPDGYELTDLRPFVKAHTEGGSQTTITSDTSGWGYFPLPTKTPYLLTSASRPLTFDMFPAGSDPDDVIVCEEGIAPLSDEQYQSALRIEREFGTTPTADIVLSEYGWRYTFSPVGGA